MQICLIFMQWFTATKFELGTFDFQIKNKNSKSQFGKIETLAISHLCAHLNQTLCCFSLHESWGIIHRSWCLGIMPKLLDNSKLAIVCCSDELRGWVSNNSPISESCTSTSPFHPLELTGNFLVTVFEPCEIEFRW